MKKRADARLLAFAISVIPALSVSANGMRLSSQDAFASARGEAFAATADNASAVYYNPAGITQLEGSNLRGGIYGIYFNPSFTSPTSGNTYHTKNSLAAAPQLFYTYHLPDSPLSFGAGIYAPFGLGLTWPQDTGFRAVGTKSALTYLRFNPVVALKLPYKFSLAAGVSANYSSIDLEQGLRPFEQPLTNFFQFKGSGWSVGYNLGLLWQPRESVSIGGCFRSSTTFTMDGHTKFEQQPIIPETHLPAQADFTFPWNAVFGLSYRPTPQWNFEFDADYTDWSSFGTVTIRQQGTPPFPVQQDIPIKLKWQASWIYEFGVTKYFDGGWHISGGYLFNENSVPNRYYTPLVTDMDRHFFTVGAGHRGRRLDFDVTYQFGYGPTRTVAGSTPSSTPGLSAGQTADGKYDFISHAVFVTLGAHF